MVRTTSLLSRYFCKTINLKELFVGYLSLQSTPYLEEVLNTVVIASSDEVNILPDNYSLESLFTIEDILNRCIESMCKRNQSNVLSRGYNFIREGYKRAPIRGSSCIQMKAPNTIVTYLKSNSWSKLHKSVGDAVMIHLFMNTSMFLSVGSDCYVQLCGFPLMDLKVSELSCFHENSCANTRKGIKRKRVECDKDAVPSRKKRKEVRLKNKKLSSKRRLSFVWFSSINSKRREAVGKNIKVAQGNTQKEKANVKTKAGKEEKSKSTFFIQRSRIFYSMSFLEGFHQKYILNTIPNSNSGVYKLLNTIFHFNSKVDTKHHRIPKQLRGFKELAKTIIGNFNRLKLRKILNFYCPVPSWTRTLPRKWIRKRHSDFQSKVYYRFAVRAFTPIQKVFLFVRHVITKVFPPLVWGSDGNKNVVIKALNRLLALNRYERLSFDNVMSGIKVTHFLWLVNREPRSNRKPVQQSQKEASIVQTFITWVFNRFILPLLRGCFYVTESNSHKNKVFYYRKPVWRIIRGLGLQPLLGSLYKPISGKIVKEKLDKNQCEGIHQIRLLPGQKKLRPISNMTNCSKSTNMKEKKFSINDDLKISHFALQYEIFRNPKILGVSVSSSEQIYEKWRAFVNHCKQTHPTILPPMFFISLDISRCFDTLPQDQIVEFIPSCLREETYQIRKFVKIKIGLDGCIRKKYISMATEGTDCTHFISFIREGLQSGRIVAKDTVFVDKVYYVRVARDKLLTVLRKHITCSIGYTGDRFLIQETGVAQGSVLATTLNNIHYGNIENRNLMPFFYSATESVFMRWVDDYFFVTTCKMQALQFLEALYTKMPKYGCKINTKKTLLNFHVSTSNSRKKFACISGDWFPWCGYMFNCKTLECGVNYVQYIGERLQDGITFENASHPGLSMSRKLILTVSCKATPILVDCTINSEATVHKNVYQVFRFAALKFLTHAKVLRKGQPMTHHLPFYCKLAKKLPLRFWKVLNNNFRKSIGAHNSGQKRRRCMEVNENARTSSSNYKERLILTRKVVEVLCYQAFIDTLRPRKSLYGQIVRFLIWKLTLLRKTVCDINFDLIRKHSRFLEMVIV